VKFDANASSEIKSTHSPLRRISLPAGQFHRRRRFISPERVDLTEKGLSFESPFSVYGLQKDIFGSFVYDFELS